MLRRLWLAVVFAIFSGTYAASAHAWGFGDQAQICNDTEFTITTAYIARDENLLTSTWRRAGWWTISPHACQVVLDLGDLDDRVNFRVAVTAISGDDVFPIDGEGFESFCVPDTKFTDVDISPSRMKQCREGQELKPFSREKFWNGQYEGGDSMRVVRVAFHVQFSAALSAQIRNAGSGGAAPPERPPAPEPSRPEPPVDRTLVCAPEKLKVLERPPSAPRWMVTRQQDCTTAAGRAVPGCEISAWKISRLNEFYDVFQYVDRRGQPTDWVNITKGNGLFEREIARPELRVQIQGHCALR